MPGLVLVNRLAGATSTSIEEMRRHFPEHQVLECTPERIPGVVKSALTHHVDFVAVAGGDGTVGCAAQELVGRSLPLVPVPTGTRNHFAKDLGIRSVDDAVAAVERQRRRQIDVGRVNGRVFVNNSSIGLYPKLVVRREVHERRLRKGVAQLVAFCQQLRRGARVSVEIEGKRFPAWLVFVGNGPYGEGLIDLADRECLDANVLDVRVVRADRPLARLRVAGAVLLGRLARSPLVERRRSRAVTIDVPRDDVEVAVDGEVALLRPPLRYECLPLSLWVLVPAEA